MEQFLMKLLIFLAAAVIAVPLARKCKLGSVLGYLIAGMVTSIAFSIPIHSVDYWRKRLNENVVETKEGERFGDSLIQFEDPHGLSLELIETPTAHPTSIQSRNPISAADRIVGFHSATTLLRSLKETQSLLSNLMGMVLHDQEANRYRFKMKPDDSFGHFYDVVIDEQAETGRQGGGTVHHIAFRTPTESEPKTHCKRIGTLIGRHFMISSNYVAQNMP